MITAGYWRQMGHEYQLFYTQPHYTVVQTLFRILSFILFKVKCFLASLWRWELTTHRQVKIDCIVWKLLCDHKGGTGHMLWL